MKRGFLFSAVLPFLAAVSCGPMTFTMDVEMRGVSRSGLDLGRKSFSVVYLDSGSKADSLFGSGVSEGFAQKLETEYFSGERFIDIYRLDMKPGADYASKDTLLNILMDTGSDVVFLFEPPALGEAVAGKPAKVTSAGRSADSSYVSEVSVPFSIRLDVYDSMNKADSVFSFNGADVAKPVAYTDGAESQAELVAKGLSSLGDAGKDVGRRMADTFVSTWKSERHPVIYYDAQAWINAAYAANDYRWKDAMDIWIRFADSGNYEKRSCAAYNISLACYMMGDYALALEWLDRSDKDYPLAVSRELRKKINARK